jgi:hypothetical protein
MGRGKRQGKSKKSIMYLYFVNSMLFSILTVSSLRTWSTVPRKADIIASDVLAKES